MRPDRALPQHGAATCSDGWPQLRGPTPECHRSGSATHTSFPSEASWSRLPGTLGLPASGCFRASSADHFLVVISGAQRKRGNPKPCCLAWLIRKEAK